MERRGESVRWELGVGFGVGAQTSVDLDTVGRGVELEELGWELGYERTEVEVEQRMEKGGQE